MEIFIPPGPRLGDIAIEASHVSKGYGENILCEDMNFHPAAGRYHRHYRRERGWEDNAVPHDHRA